MRLMLIHPLPSRTNARTDRLANYLSEAGHEVHLVLWDIPYPMNLFFKNFFNSFKYKKSSRGKVIVHKLRRLPFFCPLNKFFFKKQVKRIFQENNLDLIISATYFNETEPPLNLPLVYDFVDDHEAYAEFYGSWIYKQAFKILQVNKTVTNQLKNSNSVIVVSDILKNYVKTYNKNVYKIPNGVESWVLNKKFKKRKYNFGKHSLVYVSGFDYWANLPNLINSLNEARKTIPDIKLVLVGYGVQIPEGKELVEKLGLQDNVEFLGQVNDRHELFEIINSCDVCLNLSEKNKRQDSASSIKVFEYSALGKPVISTRLKEVEVLNFPNIIFYKDKPDNSDLIKAIKESFNKKVDVNKMKSLVKPYTWNVLVNKFEKIIKDSLK